MKSIVFKVFLLIIPMGIFAQSNTSCSASEELCNIDQFTVDFNEKFTSTPPDVSMFCFDNPNTPVFQLFENNTLWYRFEITNDTLFTFTIDPISDNLDIDFTIFKTENECEDLLPVRCMFSGENIGAPSSECLGSTGLSINSIDTFETPGCSFGDDNFLAPLEVSAGEVYYLAIIAYQPNSSYNFTVSFDQPTSFNCESSTIETSDMNTLLYPNPTNDYLYLKDGLNKFDKALIYDVNGSLNTEIPLTSGKIDIRNYKSGIYIIHFVKGNKSTVLKFIKY